MSSSKNKISAKNVKINDNAKVINDKFFVDEKSFEEVYIEEKKINIKEKVEKLEERLIQEVLDKKQALIDKAYEEGKERAVQEAEERIRQGIQGVLEEANHLLEDANNYRKKTMEDAEMLKRKAYEEQKEEMLEVVCEMVRSIIKNDIKVEDMNVSKIYEEAIKKITYDTKKVYVKVHPALKRWLEQSEFYGYDNRFEYFYDLNIQPGDVLVETDREYIDASVEQKIEQLKEKIRGVMNDSV